ncbi:MAG: hypothetical protein IAB81_02735 [Bacteroidetes bacterium]|uniref:Uncharacterized protein n=1 Tax=Candidatus Merdivivens pullicola TaxID=2840872 RepID=A0A9D9IGW3_9BACT|nr:hypothetical protein [Candidatus Merdivivens pullicola]
MTNYEKISLALDEIRKSAYRIELVRIESFHLKKIQETDMSKKTFQETEDECDKCLAECLNKLKDILSETTEYEHQNDFLDDTDLKLMAEPFWLLYEEDKK